MTVTPTPKVALVTGANSGIGRVAARELALRGYHVFLACRDRARTQPVLEDIQAASGGTAQAEYLPLDLGNLDSVRRCAALFVERKLPLHLLIANAGLAGQRGQTESGFELTFGVCHVGHFLLVQLLLERLVQSQPARLVVVASKAHRRTNTIDFAAVRQPTQSLSGLKEYAVAKLANVLFAAELARRLHGTEVHSYALHPGVVATDVWRAVPWPLGAIIKPFMLSEQEGAKTTLYCATDPALAGESGGYYINCKRAAASAAAQDAALARSLWEHSERWTTL